MPTVAVAAGDCISSIAIAHGFDWETVWNHPQNAKLRSQRSDPNVLRPGDSVFVPEREPKHESGSTQKRHIFRMKGVPARLRLRITNDIAPEKIIQPPKAPPPGTLHVVHGDPEVPPAVVEVKPRANTPFVLDVDGRRQQGTTDDDGRIDVPIWPGARQGQLTLDPGTPRESTLLLDLGHLDPPDTIEGAKHRLQNLGYGCGNVDDEETAGFRAALRTFQEASGLKVTGELDAATRAALRERHGS
jgi:N-acetylmuramoyl-L-alanine amidase